MVDHGRGNFKGNKNGNFRAIGPHWLIGYDKHGNIRLHWTCSSSGKPGILTNSSASTSGPIPNPNPSYRKPHPTAAPAAVAHSPSCARSPPSAPSAPRRAKPHESRPPSTWKTHRRDHAATFVPYQSVFDTALKAAPAEFWLWDGIHPSPSGHALMCQARREAVGI